LKSKHLPGLFLSHSGSDKEFVEDLARKLSSDGFSVWYDDWEIHVGDSIVQKINEGIKSSDFLLIVLSKNSVDSTWVKEELNAAIVKSVESKGAFILPILLESCDIPPLLSDKKYANFSKDPDIGYQDLIEAIHFHWNKTKQVTVKMQDVEIPEEVSKLAEVSNEKNAAAIEKDWLDLLEDGNQIRIKRQTEELRKTIKSSFPEIIELDGNPASQETKMRFWATLDQIAIYFLALIRYRQTLFREDLLSVLSHAYRLTASLNQHVPGDYPRGKQADLWVGIISRVYALGAACLYLEDYEAVRSLIQVEPTWSDYWASHYWARHALTMYARSHSNDRKKGLVAFAAEYTSELPWMKEDYKGEFDSDLDPLCGFDLLQCLLVASKNKNAEASYPSFGQYDKYRIKNMLIDIVNRRKSYDVVSEIPDKELAKILLELDSMVAKEFFGSGLWIRGNWPPEVQNFLNENA